MDHQDWHQRLRRQQVRSIQILSEDLLKAEVVNYQDLLDCGSYAGAREKGLVRMEGKGLRSTGWRCDLIPFQCLISNRNRGIA